MKNETLHPPIQSNRHFPIWWHPYVPFPPANPAQTQSLEVYSQEKRRSDSNLFDDGTKQAPYSLHNETIFSLVNANSLVPRFYTLSFLRTTLEKILQSDIHYDLRSQKSFLYYIHLSPYCCISVSNSATAELHIYYYIAYHPPETNPRPKQHRYHESCHPFEWNNRAVSSDLVHSLTNKAITHSQNPI